MALPTHRLFWPRLWQTSSRHRHRAVESEAEASMRSDDSQAETSMPPSHPGTGASADFLLAKYQMMRGLKDQSVSISEKRVDLHMGLTTAVAGGLVLLAQTHITTQDLFVVIVLGSAGLLLIGLTTLRQVIERDILTVDYIRAGNRIP